MLNGCALLGTHPPLHAILTCVHLHRCLLTSVNAVTWYDGDSASFAINAGRMQEAAYACPPKCVMCCGATRKCGTVLRS
jgi:hypothetical protein